MKRGDAVVISVSVALAVVVVAAVAYSQLVLDRSNSQSAKHAGNSDSSLLVMTWGPTLCQVDAANPGCRSGHVGQMGPALVLHGLWPQPRSEQFCDVPPTVADREKNSRGGKGPSVSLPPEVQQKLQSMMSDASIMAPHEWYTHGTCSGVAPAEYFTIATSLADQASKVLNPVFAKARGKRLAPSTVRRAVDAAFGEGSGQRVGLTCRGVGSDGFVIYEVQLSLPPVVDLRAAGNNAKLGDGLANGRNISAGCQDGRVP